MNRAGSFGTATRLGQIEQIGSSDGKGPRPSLKTLPHPCWNQGLLEPALVL